MPYEVIQPKPHLYDFDIPNDGGMVTNVKTDLHFYAQLQKDLKRGFSPVVFICGRQRIGKSKVGLWLELLNCLTWQKQFNLRRYVYYEPMDAVASIEGDVYHEPRMMDECSELDRQEWYEQTHRAMAKIIITQGYKTILWIIVSPYMSDLDKRFHKYLDYLIRVDKRGKFKVWKFVKRYDRPEGQDFRRIFFDEVSFPDRALGDLAKRMGLGDVWGEYVTYSMAEKERIRFKQIRKKEHEESETYLLRKAFNKALNKGVLT